MPQQLFLLTSILFLSADINVLQVEKQLHATVQCVKIGLTVGGWSQILAKLLPNVFSL